MKVTYYWSAIPGFKRATFDLIAKHMMSERYSARKAIGFVVSKRTTSYLVGQYVERQTIKEVIHDPFGKTTESERVIFEYLPFRLQPDAPHVQFIGSARLHRRFFVKIGTSLPSYLAEERIAFNIEELVSSLNTLFSKVEIVAMKVDGLLINNRTLCSLEFRSAVDVRSDAKTISDDAKATISYARIILRSQEGASNEIEMWRSGKMVTSLDPDSHEFGKLRELVASQSRVSI